MVESSIITVPLPAGLDLDPVRIEVDVTGGSLPLRVRSLALMRRRARDYYASLRGMSVAPLHPHQRSHEAYLRQRAAALAYIRETKALEESVSRVRDGTQVFADACAAALDLLEGSRPTREPEMYAHPLCRRVREFLEAADLARAASRDVEALAGRKADLTAALERALDEAKVALVKHSEGMDVIAEFASRANSFWQAATRYGQIVEAGLYENEGDPGKRAALIEKDLAEHWARAKESRPMPEEPDE